MMCMLICDLATKTYQLSKKEIQLDSYMKFGGIYFSYKKAGIKNAQENKLLAARLHGRSRLPLRRPSRRCCRQTYAAHGSASVSRE